MGMPRTGQNVIPVVPGGAVAAVTAPGAEVGGEAGDVGVGEDGLTGTRTTRHGPMPNQENA